MRVIRTLILGAVGMALAVSTATRVWTFSEEGRLWADAVQQAPEKPRVWANLGRQAALRGDRAQAQFAYERAIRLGEQPGRAFDEQRAVVGVAEANLALLHFYGGETNTARHLIARAVDRLPGDPAIQAVSAWITRDLLAR